MPKRGSEPQAAHRNMALMLESSHSLLSSRHGRSSKNQPIRVRIALFQNESWALWRTLCANQDAFAQFKKLIGSSSCPAILRRISWGSSRNGSCRTPWVKSSSGPWDRAKYPSAIIPRILSSSPSTSPGFAAKISCPGFESQYCR